MLNILELTSSCWPSWAAAAGNFRLARVSDLPTSRNRDSMMPVSLRLRPGRGPTRRSRRPQPPPQAGGPGQPPPGRRAGPRGARMSCIRAMAAGTPSQWHAGLSAQCHGHGHGHESRSRSRSRFAAGPDPGRHEPESLVARRLSDSESAAQAQCLTRSHGGPRTFKFTESRPCRAGPRPPGQGAAGP